MPHRNTPSFGEEPQTDETTLKREPHGSMLHRFVVHSQALRRTGWMSGPSAAVEISLNSYYHYDLIK